MTTPSSRPKPKPTAYRPPGLPPDVDIRPSITQGWGPLFLHPIASRLPVWLPRIALSGLCWLLGHSPTNVGFASGSTAIDCKLCGMRLIFEPAAPLVNLQKLDDSLGPMDSEPAKIEEI